MSLLEGENELLRLKPHFLSRAWSYFFWAYCLVLTYLFATDSPFLIQIRDWAASFPFFSTPIKFLSHMPESLTWISALIIPILLVSIFRLDWGQFIRVCLLVLAAFSMRFFELGMGIEYRAMCFISIGAILYLEITRWSTQYIVTNQRLILEHRGWKNTTRTLFFSKINDLVLARNFWGRLFQYGTVIPITASGLGLGSTESSVHVGVGGSAGLLAGKLEGGMARATNQAAETYEYALYCVPSPDHAYKIILEGMQRKEV